MESDTPEMRAILRRIETLEKENTRLGQTGAMRRPRFILSLGACVLFVAGVAVGQKARESKFNDYWEPRRISSMDWLLLQAQVESIGGMVADSGVGAPTLYYDFRNNKIGALAIVDEKYLQSQPAKSVRDNLRAAAMYALNSVQAKITNATFGDFEMEFRAFDTGNRAGENKPGLGYHTFAEYRNGELILR
jgi:hypothetical protein